MGGSVVAGKLLRVIAGVMPYGRSALVCCNGFRHRALRKTEGVLGGVSDQSSDGGNGCCSPGCCRLRWSWGRLNPHNCSEFNHNNCCELDHDHDCRFDDDCAEYGSRWA